MKQVLWSILTVFALFLTLLAAMRQKSVAQEQREEVSTDSYDVYSAVLTRQYGPWFKRNEPVLIVPHTVLVPQGRAGQVHCTSQIDLDPLSRELFLRLISEKQELRIESKLRVPGTYKMLEGKANFRENDELGVVVLSTVEFSKDPSKAMVFVGNRCGDLCGDGIVLTLEKRSDWWHVTKDQLNCGWMN